MEEVKIYDQDEDDDSDYKRDTDSKISFFSYEIEGGGAEKTGCCASVYSKCCNVTFGKFGGDWLFLTLLGISMAWIALVVDFLIGVCIRSRIYLYRDLVSHPFVQYLGWIFLPAFLILFSTGFTKLIAPQAAGSGIPEMKTIMKGISLKESFSFKALIAKIIGLTATLGTGLPLGKEGPFVHIASMVSILLTKANASFRGIYENKSRNSELLAAACAVGVATAFATPIGGVLFSIEVTAVHFAVRNYWRGFYAAVCATVMHRLLAVWFKNEETLTALFKTQFILETPYTPQELFVFALIGVICGLLGAFFVWCHCKYVTFKKNSRILQWITNKSMLLYPLLVTLLYTTLTFPLGLGMFVAGELTTHSQVTGLFSNFSFAKDDPSVTERQTISQWQTPYTGFYINLIFYIIFTFFGTILASTIPVPAGIFIPVFKIGAALGRIVGEGMAFIFPNNVNPGILSPFIIPGGYAIVGASALAGAVTHTVSSSVIAFELTGQLTFAIPVMVAVFIANGIAQSLQPSIFDSIIRMKKLPYLPSIPSTSLKAYDIYVEDFMVRNVKFVWYGITFNELKLILVENKKLRTFPIVDSADSMILLGSVQRRDLITLLESNVGPPKKIRYLNEWKLEAERILEEETKFYREKDMRVQIKDVFDDKTRPTFSTGPPAYSENEKKHVAESPVTPIEPETHTVKEGVSKPASHEPSLDASLDEMERRRSRFSVTRVEGPLNQTSADKIQNPPEIPEKDEEKEEEEKTQLNFPSSPNSTVTYHTIPKKSILKKTHSFVFEPTSPLADGGPSKQPYATIHGGDSRGMKMFPSILKTKSLLKMEKTSSHNITFTGRANAEYPTHRLIRMIRKMELDWEEKQMKETVDFSAYQINPAPHQLVERSNLLQVHSIFSLLGLQHSYVTAIGRLIGVVGLKELREVIERVNSGDFSRRGVPNNRKFSFGFLSLR